MSVERSDNLLRPLRSFAANRAIPSWLSGCGRAGGSGNRVGGAGTRTTFSGVVCLPRMRDMFQERRSARQTVTTLTGPADTLSATGRFQPDVPHLVSDHPLPLPRARDHPMGEGITAALFRQSVSIHSEILSELPFRTSMFPSADWSMIGPRPWVAETFSGDSAFNSTQEIEWYLNPTWK